MFLTLHSMCFILCYVEKYAEPTPDETGEEKLLTAAADDRARRKESNNPSRPNATSTTKTVPPTVISSATSDNFSAEQAVRNTSIVISDQPEPRAIYFILFNQVTVWSLSCICILTLSTDNRICFVRIKYNTHSLLFCILQEICPVYTGIHVFFR